MTDKKESSQEIIEAYRQELLESHRDWEMTTSWEEFPKFDKPRHRALADLEHAWLGLANGGSAPMFPFFAEFRTWHPDNYGEPLDALSEYLSQGFYPPPEVLLAIAQMYGNYMDGNGERTLEECFFGNEKTKAGNYASRRAKRRQELFWTLEIAIEGGDSERDAEVAERIVARDKLHLGPESVLRAVRKHSRKVKEK